MQGQLFSQDFLLRGVRETPAWQALTDEAVASFRARLHAVFSGRDADSALNEAQTEAELISPVLGALGWDDSALPQVNLSAKRREDVPDWLLFANRQSKQQALALPKDEQRLRHGIALLEAKRWLRALDRGDPAEPQDPDAPSSQMLRYLSRADVVSDRRVKWGVLTNGAVWRLYWQDARSRAEEFFELNLAVALGVPGAQGDFDDPAPDHAMRLFLLFFGRAAFLPQDWDAAGRTLHAYAQTEARLYQEQVAQNLGQRVFDNVFAQLADALAQAGHEGIHTYGAEDMHGISLLPVMRGETDTVRDVAIAGYYGMSWSLITDEWSFIEVVPTLILVTYRITGTAGSSRHSSLWDVGGPAPVIRYHQGTVVPPEGED